MNQLTTIISCDTSVEAHIIKGRLEAEGISTFIIDEHYISAAWYLSNALGGVKVQVHKQNQEQAENIIQSIYQDEYTTEIDAPKNNTCPKCDSENYISKFSHNLLLLDYLFLMFAVIFPIRKNKHICNKCKHAWTY